MRKKINLTDLFKDSLCSFDLAKKAKLAGISPENTFYAFDELGEINDGGWMYGEKAKEFTAHIPGWKPPVYYPAINLPFAIGLLEDCDIDPRDIECHEFNGKYFLKYKDTLLQGTKAVDLFVEFYLIYKKKN